MNNQLAAAVCKQGCCHAAAFHIDIHSSRVIDFYFTGSLYPVHSSNSGNSRLSRTLVIFCIYVQFIPMEIHFDTIGNNGGRIISNFISFLIILGNGSRNCRIQIAEPRTEFNQIPLPLCLVYSAVNGNGCLRLREMVYTVLKHACIYIHRIPVIASEDRFSILCHGL